MKQQSVCETNQHLSRYIGRSSVGKSSIRAAAAVARSSACRAQAELTGAQKLARERMLARMNRAIAWKEACACANSCVSAELISLDTDILVYSVDLDSGVRHDKGDRNIPARSGQLRAGLAGVV
ncbi:MAG: hypothetical protein IPH26_22955 [Sterolibacteriaceae bacterium]|uniref:Uncharacterized protein n=1 Tax=Candidatus Methylophosphatis roskildensis TaxID=2899263 RepID=A0A9D7E308_9PROT|nr:hypothetical protein [Candidatus Methylophosphatis roskildensis]